MRNGPRIAYIMQEEGAAAVVVHGRTRACRFTGQAEFDTVAEIKACLSVPVFANGDIDSAERAGEVLARTGADGIMIGRAALGAPWLLGQIAGVCREPAFATKIAVMQEHVAELHGFYGEPGVRIARKHVQWYVGQLVELGPEPVRALIVKGFNQLEEASAQLDYLAAMEAQIAA
jgi:tRNA-dihydrouridine synthase B